MEQEMTLRENLHLLSLISCYLENKENQAKWDLYFQNVHTQHKCLHYIIELWDCRTLEMPTPPALQTASGKTYMTLLCSGWSLPAKPPDEQKLIISAGPFPKPGLNELTLAGTPQAREAEKACKQQG
jgi:hypothetical protein